MMRKSKYLFFLLPFILASCSFFTKNNGDDELKSISEEVLKKDRGIDIEIKPVEKE